MDQFLEQKTENRKDKEVQQSVEKFLEFNIASLKNLADDLNMNEKDKNLFFQFIDSLKESCKDYIWYMEKAGDPLNDIEKRKHFDALRKQKHNVLMDNFKIMARIIGKHDKKIAKSIESYFSDRFAVERWASDLGKNLRG